MSLRRELRELHEPARYYLMRGGRVIRRPHEDFKPIDPNSPLYKFDFATLERRIQKLQEPTMKTLTIESDDYDGYYMLVDDGIGMCKSKSRNVLVRIRDALNAVRETGLVGLTVIQPPIEDVDDKPRGVVLAISGNDLIVRLPDGKLDSWTVRDCRIVEPERPDKPTKFNDPEDIRNP